MAFMLDDIIIDRIQYGMAEDFNGNPLYTLTQLADATINITAESKDAVDATDSGRVSPVNLLRTMQC